MKVTSKLEEAAGLTPSQVVEIQAQEAARREYARKWGSCPRVYILNSNAGLNAFADALAKAQGGVR